MLRFHQVGNPVSAIAPADTDAGAVFDLTDFGYQPGAGVTTSNRKSGSLMTLQVGGVFVADNDGDAAFTADDAVDWDPVAGEVVATGTGDVSSIAIGNIWKDNATTDSSVYVLLNNRHVD